MILKNNYLISNILPKIQQLGKSLLIPIGLLSVLGICVVLNEAIKSDNYVNTVWTIFHNLPIIFAICVGYGMSDDEGGGALASFLIYFVSAKVSGLVTGAEAILIANGPEARSFAYVLGIATLSTGSFGGILSGILGAITFKQANNTKFIPAFSFYSGARFVPILACIYGAIWGLILPFIWIPIAKLLLSLSFIANVNPIFSVFFFGTTERLLIPFGLHRILNPVFWYIPGDVHIAGNVVELPAPHIADLQHRARLRVPLREKQEIVGQVLGQDHQVCLGISSAHAGRRAGNLSVSDLSPDVRRFPAAIIFHRDSPFSFSLRNPASEISFSQGIPLQKL